LQKKQTIRVILGSFLLLIFLISITPKKYWHDVLAQHNDSISWNKYADDHEVSKTGFNCDWNMQVATSPFTEQDEVKLPALPLVHERYYFFSNTSFYSSTIFHRALRGPPAIV
jgi:hypothetical protein